MAQLGICSICPDQQIPLRCTQTPQSCRRGLARARMEHDERSAVGPICAPPSLSAPSPQNAGRHPNLSPLQQFLPPPPPPLDLTPASSESCSASSIRRVNHFRSFLLFINPTFHCLWQLASLPWSNHPISDHGVQPEVLVPDESHQAFRPCSNAAQSQV